MLNEPRGQIAFLDTPGIHKPLHKLNVRMMEHVRTSLAEAGVVALIVDVTEAFGRGDQYVLDLLRDAAKGKRIDLSFGCEPRFGADFTPSQERGHSNSPRKRSSSRHRS
ncbi:MAG TPA: hypothetical protein VGA10_01945 [Thermoanaerobaculia bacterium]